MTPKWRRGYMETVMFMLLRHVLSGRWRPTMGQKNVRSRLWGSDLGKCSVVGVQGPRAGVPESACSLYYNEQTLDHFPALKVKKMYQSFQIWCLFTLYPISKKNMRQFRLSGENVVIHSRSYFFSPHREICPKKEEQVEFHGPILLTEILGRIFKFCSSRNYSFVLVWDGDSLAQRRFLIQGMEQWLLGWDEVLSSASVPPGLDWPMHSAV